MKTHTQQVVADTTMATGGTLTVGTFLGAMMGWLDVHQPGVLALCGIFGLFVSFFGAWLGYKAHKCNMAIKKAQLQKLKMELEGKN